jgi:predicted DNA-binding transcriptional regulator AlpA
MSDQGLHRAVPNLALRPKDAAAAIGISERKLWELTANRASGIPHFRLGRSVLYPVRELEGWLAHQAKENEGKY